MALVECPDCGRQVSDAAPACLGCGRPLAPATAPAAALDADVQLIEKTAKPYKAGMLWGVAIIVGGFFSAVPLGGGPAVFFMVTGVLVFFGSVIAGWWNHG